MIVAAEPVELRERFEQGTAYDVICRTELTGTLTPPPAKPGDAVKPLKLVGVSDIRYEERLLEVADARATRAIRTYQKFDFRKTVDGIEQENSLRPGVRRTVWVRRPDGRVTFSPDGPLNRNEVSLLRTDLYTPSLAGLLPEKPVKPGDSWEATVDAVGELTGLETLEEGSVRCTFDGVVEVGGRQSAQVFFSGTVKGVNEDGPTRQKLDGSLMFDVESRAVSYLTLKGSQELLDEKGKPNGTISGVFTVTRRPKARPEALRDEALRGLKLDADPENTALLFENAELGLQFHYPRRWRVASITPRQVTLVDPNGSGVLMTLEPTERVPTATAYRDESRAFLKAQGFKEVRAEDPRRLSPLPRELDTFALEVEKDKERVLVDYFVLRQQIGGVAMTARLLPEDLRQSREEVARVARSLALTRAVPSK